MDPVASVYDCVGSTCAKGDMYVPSKWGYVPCSVLAHQTDPNPDIQEQIKGGGWALAAYGSSKIWLWSIEFRPWNTQVKTEQCQGLASNRLTRLHTSASLLTDSHRDLKTKPKRPFTPADSALLTGLRVLGIPWVWFWPDPVMSLKPGLHLGLDQLILV